MQPFAVIDQMIIQVYRLTGCTIIDYLLGTFALALFTVVLGEFTLSLALRFNRDHIEKMESEMTQQHELSMVALKMNDKEGYRVCNDQANDAFGRYFFNMIAYSAAVLWPTPFALAWMQTRFSLVRFELAYPVSLVWSSTGYVSTFVFCYILARILFKNLRPQLPYFRNVQKSLDLYSGKEDNGSNTL
jgi:hypothetical protein